jgi:hypothetical protein
LTTAVKCKCLAKEVNQWMGHVKAWVSHYSTDSVNKIEEQTRNMDRVGFFIGLEAGELEPKKLGLFGDLNYNFVHLMTDTKIISFEGKRDEKS